MNFYELKTSAASKWVDLEIKPLLDYITSAVRSAVQDPKRIQGDINLLPWEDRVKISERAAADAVKAVNAQRAEQDGDHKESIRLWGQIFGSAFPTYG